MPLPRRRPWSFFVVRTLSAYAENHGLCPWGSIIRSPYEGKKVLTESERHLNLFFRGCASGKVKNHSLPPGENDL
jgi:hypothetical protein